MSKKPTIKVKFFYVSYAVFTMINTKPANTNRPIIKVIK